MASDRCSTLPAESTEASRRLGDQLHALSRVAETLTYRLLDLEEKLAAQEELLGSLIGSAVGSDPIQVEQMEQRHGETEARLANMEELLAGAETSSMSRHLQALPTAAAAAVRRHTELGMISDAMPEEALIDELFPEEAEQPFMDERIA
jgi:hypothetical protein